MNSEEFTFSPDLIQGGSSENNGNGGSNSGSSSGNAINSFNPKSVDAKNMGNIKERL